MVEEANTPSDEQPKVSAGSAAINGDASEEHLDVTAAINVDDDIVRGTASVQHSADGHPLDYDGNANGSNEGNMPGGLIKVKHYLQEEAGLQERALSQADQRD